MNKLTASLPAINPKNSLEVFHSKTPSFVLIQKNGGEAVVKALLVKLINSAADFFNVGKNMNPTQVIETVNLLMGLYNVLKPDDFILCFKYAKSGHYGTVYDRIDGNVIIGWMEAYLSGKAAELEEYHRNQNIRIKKGEDLPSLALNGDQQGKVIPKPDWFTLPEKKVPEIKANEVKLTPEQIMFNGFIKQFDKRWLVRPHQTRNGRWIKYRGRVVNVEDYMSLKADQLIRVREYLKSR